MNIKYWFSASARMAILVENEPEEKLHCNYCVFLILATSREDALSKAIELGRKEETSFKNHNGNTVVWKLADIDSLDRIAEEDSLDGKEVYSHYYDLELREKVVFGHVFHPENSIPVSCGVKDHAENLDSAIVGEKFWFCVGAQLAILTENEPRETLHCIYCMFMVLASDHEEALSRAIVLGKDKEASFRDNNGNAVVWKLAEIDTVDRIEREADSLDGKEVYSYFLDVELEEKVEFGHVFYPESSTPGSFPRLSPQC